MGTIYLLNETFILIIELAFITCVLILFNSIVACFRATAKRRAAIDKVDERVAAERSVALDKVDGRCAALDKVDRRSATKRCVSHELDGAATIAISELGACSRASLEDGGIDLAEVLNELVYEDIRMLLLCVFCFLK